MTGIPSWPSREATARTRRPAPEPTRALATRGGVVTRTPWSGLHRQKAHSTPTHPGSRRSVGFASVPDSTTTTTSRANCSNCPSLVPDGRAHMSLTQVPPDFFLHELFHQPMCPYSQTARHALPRYRPPTRAPVTWQPLSGPRSRLVTLPGFRQRQHTLSPPPPLPLACSPRLKSNATAPAPRRTAYVRIPLGLSSPRSLPLPSQVPNPARLPRRLILPPGPADPREASTPAVPAPPPVRYARIHHLVSAASLVLITQCAVRAVVPAAPTMAAATFADALEHARSWLCFP